VNTAVQAKRSAVIGTAAKPARSAAGARPVARLRIARMAHAVLARPLATESVLTSCSITPIAVRAGTGAIPSSTAAVTEAVPKNFPSKLITTTVANVGTRANCARHAWLEAVGPSTAEAHVLPAWTIPVKRFAASKNAAATVDASQLRTFAMVNHVAETRVAGPASNAVATSSVAHRTPHAAESRAAHRRSIVARAASVATGYVAVTTVVSPTIPVATSSVVRRVMTVYATAPVKKSAVTFVAMSAATPMKRAVAAG
jgi:negative regulator of sigma E activity